MGLLPAAPACDLAVLDLDERTRRPHAGMGLEWPLVFSLDDLRGALERLIDIPVFLVDATLAHARFANVIVKRSLFGEGRVNLGPFDLELLRRLRPIPCWRRRQGNLCPKQLLRQEHP